jgi:hypothetical protein
MKKWRDSNPEWVKEFNKDRRENIKYKYGTYVTSSKHRGIEFVLNESEFMEIIKKDCSYCGTIDSVGFNGIDRLDSDGTYCIDNCVSCCKMCNYMKCGLDRDIFICICEHITTFNHLSENGKLFEEAFYNYNPNYGSCKHGANKRNIDFEISKNDYLATISEPCYICGKKNNDKHTNGIDRFDSKFGYTIDNIRSCCGTCNYMKKDYEYDTFIDKCKQIYEYNKTLDRELTSKSQHFMRK